MAKFNFDVEREVKYSRKDGGKAVRIILLFCLVAAVTAAVIYFILPKNDPEKAPAVQPPAPAPGRTVWPLRSVWPRGLQSWACPCAASRPALPPE